jgi:lysyl endopeptidase
MTWFKRSTWVTLSAGYIMLGLWASVLAAGTSSGAPTAQVVLGYTKAASAADTASPTIAPLAPTLPSPRYQWAIAHPQLPPETVDNLKSLKASQTGGRLQIGLGRAFDQPLVVNSNTAPAADWTLMPDGWRVWSIDVASVGAQGVRVHLDSLALPAGARIVVYDPANPNTPSRPVTAESLAGAKDYWVETLLAERVIVECQVPPGGDTSQVCLAVAGVSHIYQLPPVPGTTNEKAGSCENDVSCFPAFAQEAKAIARIGFVSGGNAFLCTGFLIADSSSGGTQNYFMTANHCVGNQSTASTLEFWWMYQSSSCNGTPPSLGSVPHTGGGATLLTAGSQSDYSFSQLHQAPPSGSFFLGWSLSPPGGSEALTSIHHPTGSPTAISFGREVSTDGNFWNVQWNSGVTENGSSGGPLLDASHLVIGQLMGGASSCSNPSGVDSFGRFDVSYPNFQQYLTGGGGGSTNSSGFVNGTYTGLFADPQNGVAVSSSGNVTLSTTSKGKFSGAFHAGSSKFSVRGAFDGSGNADVTTSAKAWGTVEVQLTLDPSDSDHISGTVSTSVWSSSFDAYRNVFDGRKSIAFEAGRYTIDIMGNATASDQPNGDSYATATVTKAGRVSVAGTLADGTKFSQATTISKDGAWPFYVSAYSSQGSLFSWLLFTNSDTADLGGSFNWIKPVQPKSKFYPDGFSTVLNATGCTYAKPPRGTTVLNFTDANVTFSGGSLNQSFSNAIALDVNSRVFNQSSNNLKMTFSLNTGTFSGRVEDPNSGLIIPFFGIVLQKPNIASGYFQESGLSGDVSVTGVPQ